MVLYPLTFRFGTIGVDKLSIEDKNLYKFIGKEVTKKTISYPIDKSKNNNDLLVTTPLFKKTIQESPNYISDLFVDWCENIAQISKKNKFILEDIIVLINLQGNVRHKQIGQIALPIRNLLRNETAIKIILLVNNKPAKEDIQFNNFYKCLNDNTICIIDKKGNIESKNKIKFKQETFLKLDKAREPLSYDLITRKLIRKIGHFKIKPTDEHCNRYFYDGEYCIDHIRDLVIEYLYKNVSDTSSLSYIVYSSRYSPWLVKSLSSIDAEISNELKGDFPNYKKLIDIKKFDEGLTEYKENDAILLIVDFVETAKTLKEETTLILDKIGINNKRHFKCISILNNKADVDSSNNLRKYKINNEEFELTYFAGVEVLHQDSDGNCDYCKMNLIPIDPLKETTEINKLNTIDFWRLSDEGDYKPESDVPSYANRKPLDLVPKFENWVENNSTYLAHKLKKFITAFKKSNSIDFVIIYPLEKEQKNVAHLFALKLKELYQYNIIAIPREVIDQVKDKSILVDDIKKINSDWRIAIDGLTSSADLVILDEFHNNGGTYESICKVLNVLGSSAKSYFVIADFNPKKSNTYKQKNENFNVYSLYEFQYTNN